MFNMSIPKISDEELLKRYEQIKPIVTRNGKKYHLREYTLKEMTETSYIWKLDEDIREEVGNDEFKVWEGKDFACLHKYGYHGFFKPSIAEILSQIGEYELAFVKAFEIIDYPETKSDFGKNELSSIAFDNGFHVSIVRLYLKK